MSNDNFLDLAKLDEIPDQVLLENGSEHNITIISAELGQSKPENKTAGQHYLMVKFKSIDEADSGIISDVFMLPFTGEVEGVSLDKDQFNMRGRQLRTFLVSFDIDYKNVDVLGNPAILKGAEGKAIIGVRESDEYPDQNVIKKYL